MSRNGKSVKVSAVEEVDTSKLTSMDLVDGALCQHRELFASKYKFMEQIRQAKNDSAASYREQLKQIKEELDGQMANIKALESHQKLINANEILEDNETEEENLATE